MSGNKEQKKETLKEEAINLLERKGWDFDYPQVKQVELYRDDVELRRGDIIAFKDKRIIIIQIEKSNPVSLIGTIGSINISNFYRTKGGEKESLKDIFLFIIIPKDEETKKDKTTKEQIKTIKKYFKIEGGSLNGFEIITLDEFEKML